MWFDDLKHLGVAKKAKTEIIFKLSDPVNYQYLSGREVQLGWSAEIPVGVEWDEDESS